MCVRLKKNLSLRFLLRRKNKWQLSSAADCSTFCGWASCFIAGWLRFFTRACSTGL